MKIISHRGYWVFEKEKNTFKAFERSFSLGFGCEFDVRDYRNELVISHDISNDESLKFIDFIKLYVEFGKNLPLAINIKSDGLSKLLKKELEKYSINNYFLFDMSLPQSLDFIKNDLVIYMRQSEYEKTPLLYQNCDGIWLDCFEKVWYDFDLIETHLKNGKTIAIVSPELHKRKSHELWELLKKWNYSNNSKVLLCTDFPEDARIYFDEQQDQSNNF